MVDTWGETLRKTTLSTLASPCSPVMTMKTQAEAARREQAMTPSSGFTGCKREHHLAEGCSGWRTTGFLFCSFTSLLGREWEQLLLPWRLGGFPHSLVSVPCPHPTTSRLLFRLCGLHRGVFLFLLTPSHDFPSATLDQTQLACSCFCFPVLLSIWFWVFKRRIH